MKNVLPLSVVCCLLLAAPVGACPATGNAGPTVVTSVDDGSAPFSATGPSCSAECKAECKACNGPNCTDPLWPPCAEYCRICDACINKCEKRKQKSSPSAAGRCTACCDAHQKPRGKSTGLAPDGLAGDPTCQACVECGRCSHGSAMSTESCMRACKACNQCPRTPDPKPKMAMAIDAEPMADRCEVRCRAACAENDSKKCHKHPESVECGAAARRCAACLFQCGPDPKMILDGVALGKDPCAKICDSECTPDLPGQWCTPRGACAQCKCAHGDQDYCPGKKPKKRAASTSIS